MEAAAAFVLMSAIGSFRAGQMPLVGMALYAVEAESPLAAAADSGASSGYTMCLLTLVKG